MRKPVTMTAGVNRKTLLFSLTTAFGILLYWEVLLYYQLHRSLRGMSPWNVLFLIPVAFFFASLTNWFSTRKKTDGLISILLIILFSLFYLIDLVYYRTFGSLFSVSMMGTGVDAVTSFFWSIRSTLRENILAILLLEVPALLELLYIYKKEKDDERFPLKERFAMMLCAITLWCLIVWILPLSGTADHSAYGVYHSRYTDTDTAAAKLGALPNFIVELKCSIFGSSDTGELLLISENVEEEVREEIPEAIAAPITYNRYDGLFFSDLKKESQDKTIDALCDYLAEQPATRQNEYTGLFEGYNLIYICAESFSSLAIDEEVTPTLYNLANGGIVLNNYYNSFKNTTTNGEYAFLTGLWPDVARKDTNMGKISGTMGQSMDKNMDMALGNIFKRSEGVQARAYHNYLGDYYGRNRTLPNMGFECKFMNDGMKFTTAWPASDLEMMEQSIDDYINEDRFCTYYMTFSGHGNYTSDNIMVARNLNTVSSLVSEYLPTSALGYLSANYELEKAMNCLIGRLAEAGKLENTVIVLTGDHYPYYLTDAGYEALKGARKDETFESYRSTCIIYKAGLKEKIEVDTPCCNVDILPTICNLFGLSYDSRLYAGCDVFSDGDHVAQLYNKTFITDKVKYDYASGEAQWLDGAEEENQDVYLERMKNVVKNRYAMSVQIEDSDFYSFVFDNYKTKKNTQINEWDLR